MRLITDMDAIDSYVKTLYDIWMDKKESPRECKVCRQAHITIRRLEILWTKDKGTWDVLKQKLDASPMDTVVKNDINGIKITDDMITNLNISLAKLQLDCKDEDRKYVYRMVSPFIIFVFICLDKKYPKLFAKENDNTENSTKIKEQKNEPDYR